MAMTMEEARDKAIATEAAGGMEKPDISNPPTAVSKFTEKNRQGILAAVAGGTPIDIAAALVGVRKKTVEDWIYKGMDDADKGIESEYATFAVQAQQALAMPIAEAAGIVTRAIKRGDVATAFKFLERRTKEYARHDQVEQVGGSNPNAPVVIHLSWPTSGMPDREQQAIEAGSEEITEAEIVDDAAAG